MSDIVTMGPCMANPEALKTVKALRAALAQANVDLLTTTQSAHVYRTSALELASLIANLVGVYHRDGISGVAPLLDHIHAVYGPKAGGEVH